MGKEGSTVSLSLHEHPWTHLELFGTTNSTIAKACLNCLNSQGENGDAVIPF